MRLPRLPLFARLLVGLAPLTTSSIAAAVPITHEAQTLARPPSVNPYGSYGCVAAVLGDTLVVGAGDDNTPSTFAGSVQQFTLSGGTWSFTDVVLPSTPQGESYFGNAVALSQDVLVVGAQGWKDEPASFSDIGTTWILGRQGGAFQTTDQLFSGTAADDFGWGVAINETGTIVVATAPFNDATSSSGAYVFVNTGGSWTPELRIPGDMDQVSISGDTLAYRTDAGVSIHVRSGGTWPIQQTLSDPSGNNLLLATPVVQGDTLLTGTGDGTVAGRGYVFVRSGATWTLQATLIPGTSSVGDYVGSANALDGDTAVLGAGSSAASPAFVFKRSGTAWTETEELRVNNASNVVALRVVMSGDWVMLSDSIAHSPPGEDSCPLYAFHVNQLGPTTCSSPADCSSGFCVDGLCCDTACGGGADDCQACSIAKGAAADGTCQVLPSSHVCRPSAGPCDVEERCDGASVVCPADLERPDGATCGQAGTCRAGVCSGGGQSSASSGGSPSSGVGGASASASAGTTGSGRGGGRPAESDGGAESGGCGCKAAPSDGAPGGLACAILMGLAAWRRRR